MIKPFGAKYLVEVEEKKDQGVTTAGGIFIQKQDKDSSDRAMLYGKIVEVGSKEVDAIGNERVCTLEAGTHIMFNRYNAFKTVAKGVTDIWIVHVNDIWTIGELDEAI